MTGRHAVRPTQGQQASMRKALLDAVAEIIDAWPAVRKRIDEYGDSYGPGQPGIPAIGRRGSPSDKTGNMAAHGIDRPEPDPREELWAWERDRTEMLGFVLDMAERARGLLGPGTSCAAASISARCKRKRDGCDTRVTQDVGK